jgi:polyisoprenoid-binding protein YceI
MRFVRAPLATAVFIWSLAGLAKAAASPVDVDHSTLTIRVFKSGLFSGFAHNHIIAAPLSSGTVDPAALSVEVHFDAQKLKVLDPDASAGDRAQVQETMLSDKLLDTIRFPDISFISRNVKLSGENAYTVEGELTLHGVTHLLAMPVSLRNGHYQGSVKLKQSDFGIAPISLYGGSVKVKDVVEITFDVVVRAN